MIALWIAAALQSDWSEHRRERALSPEEVEELRVRLDAWGNALGVEAFRGFGRAVTLSGARELPVYHVRATTLDERREIERPRKPYEGSGTLTRTSAKEVDLQAPPLPPFQGFEPKQWRVPVEGSARTLPCPGCGADGRVTCARCQGRRTQDCDRCRGAGKLKCSTCDGTSKIRCTSCFGWGSSGTGSKRKNCSWCWGSGKRPCGSCASGQVHCGSCGADGKVDCGGCRGKGEQDCGTCKGRKTLVETLEIVISLRTRTREAAVTLLPERWTSKAGATEPWDAAEGEEAERRIVRIGDPELAAAARRTLEESRKLVAGRARGSQVKLRRTPCIVAKLRWEAMDVEVALFGDDLHFDPSPATAWAAGEAERAEEIYPSDKEAARTLATLALRADPDCWRARRLLNALEGEESEERARAEQFQRESKVKQVLLTVLYVLASLVAVTMILLKLYLRRRRPAA